MLGFSRIASLLVLVCCFAFYSSYAQLPNGSFAPDFTAVDINGVEHTLSDYLDLGVPVILEVSVTWCTPCWNYHQSGAIQDFYSTYGLGGTGEAMVLFLEGDDNTSLDDLNGTGGNTTGDWVSGSNFPIIDNAEAIGSMYQISYYPTIFKICPSGILTEIGQPTTAEIYASINESDCLPASLLNDPALIGEYQEYFTCGATDLSVDLFNAGLNPLTAVDITLEGCSVCPQTQSWMGNLTTYQIETVMFNDISVDQEGELNFYISSPNDNLLNDTLLSHMNLSTGSTTEIHIEVTTDCYPTETSWQIFDEFGTLVASGDYSLPETFHTDVVSLPEGCYTFTLYDSYGDGLQGTQFGCASDGNAQVFSVFPGTEEEASLIYANLGENNFSAESVGLSVCDVDCVLGCTDPIACNYDVTADIDDGSCGYVLGCTDPNSQNFDPTAICDDGSCFLTYTCAQIGNPFWQELESDVYPQENSQFEYGIPVDAERVVNVGLTFLEPNLNLELPVQSMTITAVSNEPPGLSFQWPSEELLAGTQHCIPLTGTPTSEGVFVVEFNCLFVVEIFGTTVSVPDVILTHTIEITPNMNGIDGCTYPSALNYNPLATIDDGTCEFLNPEDLCGAGTVWNPIAQLCETISSCTGDLNGDGVVNSADLLTFLSAYGSVCD